MLLDEIAAAIIGVEPNDKEELKKIIYPGVGEDIVTLKMVKYVGFEDGVAIIDVDIPKFDKFRDNVAEEIKEHLETFKEIKEVKVTI